MSDTEEDRSEESANPANRTTVVFYGTRGSIPVCQPGFEKYGGNTTSILITVPGAKNVGIIDAGTGIRQLGRDIMKDPKLKDMSIDIAFTHFHWDHIQGFPFFTPAFVPGKKITLMALGRDRPVTDLERVFATQMQQEYFPVPITDMRATIEYELAHDDVRIFPRAIVSAQKHNHPGSAYSYCLSTSRNKIVVCTDIEHGEDLDPTIVKFCEGADLLIHEAQYTPEELKTRRGWGHSSYEQAIECARRAGVGELLLTHHDPDHDDTFLDEIEKRCQDLHPNCRLARDGMSVTV